MDLRGTRSLLERFVGGNTHYEASACRTLLNSIFGSDETKKVTLDRFSSKSIVYVRHGETPINVWVEKNPIKFKQSLYPRDASLYNPGLTDVGLRSCEVLRRLLEQNYGKFDIVFSSPYQRTIHTYDSVRTSTVLPLDPRKKLIVTPLIRERASIPASVVGYPKSYLTANRSDIDCSLLAEEHWWRSTQQDRGATTGDPRTSAEVISREDNEALQFRVLVFLTWLAWREENSIIFFSHCSVYEAIKNFLVKKPPNAVPITITKGDLVSLMDSLSVVNT